MASLSALNCSSAGRGLRLRRSWIRNISRICRSSSKSLRSKLVRTPRRRDEAKQQSDERKRRGVDGIKAILEAGAAGMLFQRMDVSMHARLARRARSRQLPITMPHWRSRDVADSRSKREPPHQQGSMRDQFPVSFCSNEGAKRRYDPTLTAPKRSWT